MDPRQRADAALARARARGGFVVTPDNAVSPMDAANTQKIPRAVVAAAEVREDPEPTVVLRDGEEATQPRALFDEGTTERRQHPMAGTSTTVELPTPQEPVIEEQDGLIPTVTRAEGTRPNVAQRLDGATDTRSRMTRRLDG
ncbi:hypothetical protein EV191_10968 [Tamaricihabitans halophyticus]|uniref:Uncharacterized protein n=1 Tax=Tamaricihabitans halophyticus TaxID=1262583 RepID=A0A4V2ST35_9PSEU|nr:hypothetical protein [Tamaricihabitans halophyticus]TCP49246.1 hypothetical protein EV191_10968 [Tamaricihabitans halophyticus]